MSLIETLCQSILKLDVVELQDNQGRKRVVEPYIVYTSSKGKVCLHCYQLSGHSESGAPTGWKNPQLASLKSVRSLGRTFTKRSEYNPDNQRRFPNIHCKA